jgi:hypothetical protein
MRGIKGIESRSIGNGVELDTRGTPLTVGLLGGGSAAPAVQLHEHTLVFQPNSLDGLDARISNGDQADMKYDNNLLPHSFINDRKYRSVLKFDFAGYQIPATAEVVSAPLALTCYDAADHNDTIRLYRILQTWIESQVTWNSRITGTAWGTAGCDGAADREAVEIATVSRLTTDTQGTVKTIALPASKVQDWISGAVANNGLLLKGDNETTGGFGYIYASNDVVAANRPKLTLTWRDSHSEPANAAEAWERTITWIKYAQDVLGVGGGVNVGYHIDTGLWHAYDYVEVTGYIIASMYDYYHATGDSDAHTRAISMADWLLTKQDPVGSFSSTVFNTGQDILGLIKAYEEEGTAGYLTAAIAAGDWLLTQIDGLGRFTGGYVYHSRVAWSLLRLWQATSNVAYRDAAILNLEWVLTQQNAAGWFANNPLGAFSAASPLLHVIVYTMRGLYESGMILNDTDYINAAILATNGLIAKLRSNGSFGTGQFTADWSTPADLTEYDCLTGDAQLSILLWKLYHHTSNAAYKTAAQSLNAFLRKVQGRDQSNAGIFGGCYGSWPIDGPYQNYTVINHGTKFAADAFYLETVDGAAPAGAVNA